MEADTDRLVNASEARRILGNITDMTLWRWRQRYDEFPPAVIIGNRKYFHASEIEAWIKTRRDEGATAQGPNISLRPDTEDVEEVDDVVATA